MSESRYPYRSERTARLLVMSLAGFAAAPLAAQGPRASTATPPPASPLAATLPPTTAAASNTTCLACHGMSNLGYRDRTGAVQHFAVSGPAFQASAHAAVQCAQCHPAAAQYPHGRADGVPRTTCDGDCHATDALGRPYTHAAQADSLRHSAHGRAVNADHPTCLTCHGAGDAHAVARTTGAPPAVRMARCITCHDNHELMARYGVPTDAVASYERSFHYKAIRFGGTHTAACPDCHTAHGMLPADDSASTVWRGNLTRTCGQANCHAGAKLNFASSGANHLDLRVSQSPILHVEELMFKVLTLGTMAMLLVGIVLDIQKKFGWLALARAAARSARRRTPRVSALFDRLRPALARSAREGLRVLRVVFYD